MPLYLMPLIPFVGFLILITFGGRVFKGSSGGWIGSLAVLGAFVVAASNYMGLDKAIHEQYFTWLPYLDEGKDLKVGFYLDQVSSLMTLVITGVGFLIHVFSIGYMQDDPRYTRFFAFLNFFVALMLILVLGDSYPLMFVGWEGVGTASFLLIGFWYNKRDYANAARKAFIMNRIGDLGFMLAMFLLYKNFGTLVIPDLAEKVEGLSAVLPALELVGLFLLLGAAGKSGQIPLTTWLPDAMAGPTPVSALIHAATMVTAGVYLIARSYFLYEKAPVAHEWVAWVGALTALYGALSAINQYDIKKILAYSTVSQIGYMILAVGVGAYWAGMFHLVMHAFFKALLFLTAGSVIHGCHHEQDVRQMGGLAKKMPLTHAVGVVGWLSIAGIPIFSGFFSKDAILTSAFEHNVWMYGIGLFVALLTAFYMTRWYVLVFRGEYRGHAHPHESGPIMTFPLIALAALSTLGGFLGLPHIFQLGENRLAGYLGKVLPAEHSTLSESTEWTLIAVAVGTAALGIIIGFTLYRQKRIEKLGSFENASLQALYVNSLYDSIFGAPARGLARGLDAMDRGVEGGLEATARVSTEPGGWLTHLQSGYVRAYASLMLVGTAALLVYLAVRVLGGLQ
ncbi:NADH-quinone oxidoreductase subunit L [Deinococcus roseus]|uniref:NADH-quinone oxidoreductase subunit L n=1 Tax=Deinococcus roseus TaxID=392414 RepID=A0ABQ2CTV7_9DEIO|nr:NADH-quinone oxidoreductase subunit L [Deinococcus roseus]GGJ20445.1 NADH-quinone oxidoreductase subunit L [Deinococcus roseus]